MSEGNERIEHIGFVDDALMQASLNSTCKPLTVEIQKLDQVRVVPKLVWGN